MTWDYAELTHAAKEFGGPQGLVNAIYEGGVVDGFIDGGLKGVIVGAFGTLFIGGIAFAIKFAIKNTRDSYKLKTAKAKEAEAVLIQALESETKADEQSNQDS